MRAGDGLKWYIMEVENMFSKADGWVQIPGLPVTSGVSLGKLLNFFVL